MRHLLSVVLLGLLPVQAADEAARTDLLRFSNGDRLEGRFTGMKQGPVLVWKRDDVSAPVEFKTSQLRQVVLQGGRPAKTFADLSSVGLVNGDRLPGTVTAMDENEITVDTAFSGPLILPRKSVSMIAPNPLGGRLLYSGPFSEEGWSITPTLEDPNLPGPSPEKKEKEGADTAKTPPWSYSSGAWYSRQGQGPLIREVGMADRSVLRFQLAWKSRLSLAIAFHADLKTSPKGKPGDDGKISARDTSGASAYPRLFGNAYVMNLYPNYVILYRSGFDADGKPFPERIQSASTNIRLAESGEATVELRCNRQTGEISLFLNDEFAVQWAEPGGANGAGKNYAGLGGAIGFLSQGASAPIRISDVVVSEWNGMPDAARSLQVDDQDIVLLANGTDRFSGDVTGLANGRLQLKGRYGNFEFPLPEVAEVRFARNKQVKKAPQPASDEVLIRFHPFGRISGVPAEGAAGGMTLNSSIVGKTRVNLDYAVMLDFKNSTSFLDDWDPQF